MDEAAFDFALPPERIAQHPASPRDTARLLHVAQGGAGPTDLLVRDLPSLVRPGDVLVVNDTRVIPAQLEGRRGAARIGITLNQPLDDGTWHALARNARRLRPEDRIDFAGGLTARVLRRAADGGVVLAFDRDAAALEAAFSAAGALALPPYIARPQGPTAQDATDYQTMFAAHPGAVAAPTAGLHFTPALRHAVEAAGARIVPVTLHVGAGTFLPLRGATLSGHRLHGERAILGAEAAATINARPPGGRLIAVGTTSLRLLETAADADGVLHPFDGVTDLFIKPGHRFRTAELLLTNFHLPRSTLFVLVCAFAGIARMRAAYDHAIAEGYRFYSYGDASLLERAS